MCGSPISFPPPNNVSFKFGQNPSTGSEDNEQERSYAVANWISTVCKITCLGVSSIQQRVNCLLAVVCGCTCSGFSFSQCHGLLDL